MFESLKRQSCESAHKMLKNLYMVLRTRTEHRIRRAVCNMQPEAGGKRQEHAGVGLRAKKWCGLATRSMPKPALVCALCVTPCMRSCQRFPVVD